MKANGAFIQELLLEMGIPPASFSEPLLRLVRERLSEIENAVLQRTGAATAEFTLQGDGSRKYLLPREIFSVESLLLNGRNITDCRVPATEIEFGD